MRREFRLNNPASAQINGNLADSEFRIKGRPGDAVGDMTHPDRPVVPVLTWKEWVLANRALCAVIVVCLVALCGAIPLYRRYVKSAG
jgi:hypothetical protein